MDKSIYELIKENKAVYKDENKNVSDKETFLLFSVKSKIYGVPSFLVRELLKDADVFPLPFVPSYVDGVLNRYGEAYVVIDPALLFKDTKQDSSLFLVFKGENRISIRITDVYDFYTLDRSEIKTFSDKNKSVFFEGTFKYNDNDVFVMRQDFIIERIEKDFERM